MAIYRITTQVVNADGALGDIVDIVEMESSRDMSRASSYELWEDYKAAQRAEDSAPPSASQTE